MGHPISVAGDVVYRRYSDNREFMPQWIAEHKTNRFVRCNRKIKNLCAYSNEWTLYRSSISHIFVDEQNILSD